MAPSHKRALGLSLLLAGILLTSTLFVAQPYPPPWRDASAGIRRAAVVHALAASADGQTVYAASYEPNGLARSVDGGETWNRLAPWDGWGVPLSVGVDPGDADRVYVGLVSGARRSADGGETWAELPGLASRSVNAWLVAPGGTLSTPTGGCAGHAQRPVDCVYAGTSAGLLASTDGGESWDEVPGAPDHAVLALLLDPADQQTLYVGTDRGGVYVRDRDGWRGGGQGHANALAGDPATGHVYAVALHRLFRTADRGRTWGEIPWAADPSTSFAKHPERSEWAGQALPPLSLGLVSTPDGPILYASAVEGQGLYRSADEGATWQRLDRLSPAGCSPLCGTTALSVLALGGPHVLVGTDGAGMFATRDSGESWAPVDVPLGQPMISAVLPHPTDSGVVFAGASDGVYRSTNRGVSWQLVSGALGHLDVLSLAVDPRDPKVIYAGTFVGVYRSTDGGNFWHPWTTGIPDVTIYSLTFDPRDPATIYAGSRGNNVCRTTNGGVDWAPIHNGLETLTAFDVLVDARNPRVLTVGTVEDVYRSIDGGESWQKLEGPLEGLSTFCLLEVEGDLWAGTTDGVYVSRDGGTTWTARREGMGSLTAISLVRDPARPDVLYVGTEGAGLYRSVDGGTSWQAWARGIERASVHALAFDPFDGTRLPTGHCVYAATDRGVFVLEAWVP